MTKSKGITKEKLTKHYPKLAKVLDTILEKEKAQNYWFYVNYCGKYKDRQGNPRTVSIGSIIDLVSEYGYTVDITPRKN